MEEEPKAFSVNQYQVTSRLGEGAYGEVRLATNADGKKFAVKILSRSFLKKKREFVKSGAGRPKIKTALDDVLREIAIMKKISKLETTKCLVGLEEVIDDESDDQLFIVLEFVAGGQSMYYKGSKKRYFVDKDLSVDHYEEARAKELCKDVIEGLRFLHGQGIVHRDLKPENLLLSEDNTCKIADFGIAQKLDLEKNKSVSLTSMAGTYQFMSPETITQPKYNAFKVDIWAFGVCLYCFACGELPFWGDSPEEVFEVVEKKALSIPSSFSEELKECLAAILEKDPAKRVDMEQLVALPWFGIQSVDAVQVLELTEKEKLDAITPRMDFAATAMLKVKAARWKKQASERSKMNLTSGSSSDREVKDAPSPSLSNSGAGDMPIQDKVDAPAAPVKEVEVNAEDPAAATATATAATSSNQQKGKGEEEVSSADAAKSSSQSGGSKQAKDSNKGDRNQQGCCVIV